MFTIIIIQNTIKLGFLRSKLKTLNNSPDFLGKNKISEKESKLKSAICLSCSDFMRLICCGMFFAKKSVKPDPIEKIRKFDNFTGINNDLSYDSDLNQSCTTITRPGYILQVPNATISGSILAGNDTTILNKDPSLASLFVPNNKVAKKSGQNRKKVSKHLESTHKSRKNEKLEDDFNQQQTEETFGEPSCIPTEFSNLDSYENEVFYHVKNKKIANQLSSAF